MIIDYFGYRWPHYKYHVFRDEYENITTQLPAEHIDILLRTMVYRPFIDRYQHVLEYEKENPKHLHARYTWNDPEYKSYMRGLISVLEPRSEPAGTTLIEEQDEFLEVIFFTKGRYSIGYSLNGQEQVVQTFTCNTAGNAIGAYGVTFHKRAVIIYTTVGICRGHFVRKKNWHSMLDDLDPTLCRIIKRSFV